MDPYAKRRSLPVRVLLFFGRAITLVRNTALNLLFLFVLFILLAALFSQEQEPIPELAPLYIKFSGQLVDQYTYLSPQDRLLNPNAKEQAEMRVRDLVQVIEFAGNDNRINGLILDLNHFQGGGMSKVQEVGAALDKFKDSGKPVIAIADNFGQQHYLLATYASDIYMHSMGRVVITGYGVFRNYYKEALDKLAVDFHVFKVGQFKDFVEPYTRDSMSEQSRKHNSQWIGELWQTYVSHVESRRDLAEGALNQWINHMADHLAQNEGSISQMAEQMHLVDRSVSRVELRQILIDQFGHKPKQPDSLQSVSYTRYSKQVLKPSDPFAKPNIALVVARGTILDGSQPEGSIGGDSLAKILRSVGRDENIKALVLRIDSGGGSAFASEIIREELQAIRDKGVKVVVSMGSVTASGGYWIASAADEIWATPSTITGSIGVFGLFPTVDRSLAKIGVNTDGFGTTNLAGALRIDRPLNEEAANILQQGVENIYDRFLNLVAEGRASTPEEVHKIAQGRVWSAKRAHELGLVDQLGFLNDAITSAAGHAELEQYSVKLFERELSPQEALLKEIMEGAEAPVSLQALLEDWSGTDLTSLQILADAAQQVRKEGFNAASQTYASCLECIEL